MKAREKTIDLNYLRQHTKSDPDLMMDMINIYLEQTPVIIEAMKNGLLQKDWRLLQAAAHKIKPSFRVMGIQGNKEALAREIEEFAKLQQASDRLVQLVSDLENTCELVYKELAEESVILKKSASAKR